MRPFVADLEVLPGQATHGMSVRVDDHDVDSDQLRSRAEDGRLRLRREYQEED